MSDNKDFAATFKASLRLPQALFEFATVPAMSDLNRVVTLDQMDRDLKTIREFVEDWRMARFYDDGV